MFDGAKDALDKLKDNTALRLKLVAQLDKIHDEDKADELYKKHEKELAVDVVEIYLKKGGKTYSSLTSDKAVKWPLEYHQGIQREMIDFCEYLDSDRKNNLDLITEETAAAYGKVVLELITTAVKADKLYRENKIPYWEDNTTLEYDDLGYGDEIYDNVYTGQQPYQASPMFVVGDEAIALIRKLLYMILVK